ncbi:MAG TPA: YceI family protein [Bacteroidales bacterium]|jgi:polyisoprenoid-binding protein YceI|nr:YceI family protein [Bacteroidales bacterium]
MKKYLKNIAISGLIALLSISMNAQKYITRNGFISFYSETPVETIKADNNQVAGALDTSTGEMVFEVLNRSFHFERALMERDFNENYIESEKYPKSIFKGKIVNLSEVDFTKNGIYKVNVKGELTIHGKTKEIDEPGTVEVANGNIEADSKFHLVPEDYDIKIPGVVRNKINQSMQVTVSMKYTPLSK